MGLLKEHMEAARKERELARKATEPQIPAEDGYVIYLVGKTSDPNFQQVKAALHHLMTSTSYVQSVIEEYFETQFELRLKQLVTQYGDAMKQAKALNPLIFAENAQKKILYFKTPESFFEWAHKRFRYEDTTNFLFYKRKANKAILARQIESGRHYATIGMSIAGAPTEFISLELFSDSVPATVQNFVSLLRHRPFLGSIVHRVVPGGWVQMGDWETGSGGHSSTVSGQPLLDEAFVYKHDRPGLLTMAHAGPDRAGSQFCITLKDIAPFDGKYVVFGRVISGLRLIHRISRSAQLENERPVEPIKITEVQPDLLSDENPLVADVREELAAMELNLEDPELNAAATKIQSIQRQKDARKRVQEKKHQKEESSAATKVQGMYRQKAARQRVEGVREQKKAENHAATKVQASYRGKAGREKVKEIKSRASVTHNVDDLA